MDNLEIAKALFATKPSQPVGGQTTTAYGIAVSDSVNGLVRVNLGGETTSTDDDQTIEVDTTFAVFEGDEVIISLVGADGTGKSPTVIGVVGRGDQQQTEIDSVVNYFWTDQYGAHVSTAERSVAGANILLDSDSLDIRNGNSNSEADQTVYASFGREITVGNRLIDTVGDYSQVFGIDCIASGDYSHAEGFNTKARGDYSHAEGAVTEANADYSHAEGENTKTLSWGAHAEGELTIAAGLASHAEGIRTVIKESYGHVQGRNNVSEPEAYTFYADIIGNGTDSSHQSNAYNMDWGGNAEFQGEIYVGGCTPNGETPYPVVRYNTSNSQSEYYNKSNSTWTQVPGGGGGGATWGSIAGTLSDQTDLQNALNAKADASSAVSVTIASSDWSTNTCTKTVTGVTSSNNIIVAPNPGDFVAYANAQIRATAQGSGTVTFMCTTTPTASIIVQVLIVG